MAFLMTFRLRGQGQGLQIASSRTFSRTPLLPQTPCLQRLGTLSPDPSGGHGTFKTALAKQKLFVSKPCNHQGDGKDTAPPSFALAPPQKISCWLYARVILK